MAEYNPLDHVTQDASAIEEERVDVPKITPLIKIGSEFAEIPPFEQIHYMHKLASSMNQAAKLMQDERNALLTDIETYKRATQNLETQLMIQKNINAELMTTLNEQTQNTAVKVALLNKKIHNLTDTAEKRDA